MRTVLALACLVLILAVPHGFAAGGKVAPGAGAAHGLVLRDVLRDAGPPVQSAQEIGGAASMAADTAHDAPCCDGPRMAVTGGCVGDHVPGLPSLDAARDRSRLSSAFASPPVATPPGRGPAILFEPPRSLRSTRHHARPTSARVRHPIGLEI